MKAQMHPTYFDDAQVVCSCGEKFVTGSTKQTIHVELCSKCHPFYTGQARFVDTASRIERFKIKQSQAQPLKSKKKQENKDDQGPQTLREMLQALKR